MNQAKHKGKFLYTMACAMLSVMSFTAVTAFADTGDHFNPKHLGKYVNESNSESSITLTNTGTYAVYVTAVRAFKNEVDCGYINGATTANSYMNDGAFFAPFDKARPSDETGRPDDIWLRDVYIMGSVTKKTVLFKQKYVIHNNAGNSKFIQS